VAVIAVDVMAITLRTRELLAAWVHEHTSILATLDPRAPLDDLEPLRDIVGDARVVAVGESAHFVSEFAQARARILRFLAERRGFTVVAVESGFSEGFAVAGGGDPDGLAGPLDLMVSGELLRWLRAYGRLEYVGVDVPTSFRLGPALEPVAAYLREVDPDALPLLERALRIGGRLDGASAAANAPRWSRLDRAEQDDLTASLARLLLRLRALEPLYVERGGRHRYDLAARHLEGACHTDYMYTAMSGIFSGHGLPGDTSVRDHYMAGSLLWHLGRAGPDTRIAVVAHNNHIQKTPVSFGGQLTALPMGHYLARALGDDYRAVALTHTADHVPEMVLDETGEVGFTVADTALQPAEPGSVEGALIDAVLDDRITLTGLRGEVAFDRIRSQSATLETPVADAFDAVLNSPTVTRSPG
jgi:erythromycin esterase